MNSRQPFRLFLFCLAGFCASGLVASSARAEEAVAIGFAKRDITPKSPVRLSGYASRNEVMTGVRDPIYVRAMAIGEPESLHVVLSLESISATADLTKRLLQTLHEKHGITRSRLVVCSTHSHAAPQIWSGLTNLFRRASTEQEIQDLRDYRDLVYRQAVACVDQAIENQQPGELSVGNAEASFAVHRRVVKQGTWSGFGVSADGPVDRRVRVLVGRDRDGKLLGAVFQYACHCTTLGPSFNEVTGDWAGLAAAELEAERSSAIFLPVIGCGADANPEPRDNYDAAVGHGREMANAVRSVLNQDNLQVVTQPAARFGYAGLSAELPSREQLNEFLQDSNVNRQRWAKNMLELWDEKGRLPESYPAPIHTWTFGDQLVWVFLGGEVVVEYQIRLEKELSRFAEVWVAAYTDDVFAYVASQRMRSEGGYEVDFSMVYYNQPGRWQSGTEDLLIRRVHEILQSDAHQEEQKSPQASLRCLRVPSGFTVDLVAAEPLVRDPINLAFAADGSVWVVEMGDYPLGSQSGGKVKRLMDSDGDGKLDTAVTFLEMLDYPTSVLPWRDGAIVIAAPDVFLARDTNGDGKADEREVLLSGIGAANPQHRASGFDWGLDGWVYFGAGDHTEELTSHRTGQTIRAGRCDLRWDPDSGKIERLPGATQFVRSRDRWGRWYGNSNSVPLFHYPIDDLQLLERNSAIAHRQLSLNPGVAPPVYPRSRTVDRFNDLFAKNRFTSACASVVVRGDGLGPDMLDTALVCEPVHNLVARFRLHDEGLSIVGERFAEDGNADWLTSTDTWFRPVRAIEAPDGSLWVVDMYRRVIEHPQWIPDAWQGRMDLRAGSSAGRIYRITHKSSDRRQVKNLATAEAPALLAALSCSRGAYRDLAMQQIVLHDRADLRDGVRQIAIQAEDPATRLQAFATLLAGDWATDDDWRRVLADAEPRVVVWALTMARRAETFPEAPLIELTELGESAWRDPRVGRALLLALDRSRDSRASETLDQVVRHAWQLSWVIDALSMLSQNHARRIIESILHRVGDQNLQPDQWNRLQTCLQSLWERCSSSDRNQLLVDHFGVRREEAHTGYSQIQLLTALVAAQSDHQSDRQGDVAMRKLLVKAITRARSQLRETELPIGLRLRASQLLGSPFVPRDQQLKDLSWMLRADQPGPLRAAGLSAAYRVNSSQTAELLIDAWKQLLPDERQIAGTTLLQRSEWTRRFAQSIVDGKIKVNDLDAATINGLQNTQNYRVMKQLRTLLAKPADAARQSLVERYLAAMASQSKSDPTVSAKLYTEHCATCHEPRPGTEHAIGPALANLKKWNLGQWTSAILDPNATVEAKYKQYRVLTKSGQVFAGAVTRTSDVAVQLALSDGRAISIDRDEIDTLQDSGVSLMPEGLEAKLSPTQLAGIIMYLQSR